jgi:small subunit ribosomal protein S8
VASHDVIADMLTKIRNATQAGHKRVSCRFSNEKYAISKILLEQGFVEDVELTGEEGKKEIKVTLKYYKNAPVIAGIKRVSSPGRRIYRGVEDIPRYMNGLAVTIVSTSKGILTGKQALEAKQGGEVLCYVW